MELERVERTILSRLDRPLGFYELISVLDHDLRSVIDALDRLRARGLIRVRDGLIERTAPFQYRRLDEGVLERVKAEFEYIVRDRPEPVVEFDQGYVTVESVMRRLRALDSRDDLWGSAVFLLGDDDLTSVALCLTGFPTRVVVAEIDPRLLEFLDRCRSRVPVHLELYPYDVRNPLPDGLHRAFDVALCDPLESERGFKLFILRCRQALASPGSALYFGLTDVECPPQKWLRYEEFLLQAGLRITDIWRSAHTYVLPDRDFVCEEMQETVREYLSKSGTDRKCGWYRSSLFRTELVFDSDLLPELPGDDDIYA